MNPCSAITKVFLLNLMNRCIRGLPIAIGIQWCERRTPSVNSGGAVYSIGGSFYELLSPLCPVWLRTKVNHQKNPLESGLMIGFTINSLFYVLISSLCPPYFSDLNFERSCLIMVVFYFNGSSLTLSHKWILHS